jgi:predicted nucleotidyltransferase component of viral defense system
MSKKDLKDISASVRQRLLNISRERNEDYQFILLRYANERLLYRLSRSEYAKHLILKGATLFIAWTEDRYRPTRDLDFLGFGESSEQHVRDVFQNICTVHVEPDGLWFDPDSVNVIEIREELEYPGQRITLIAWLGNARINMQADIGFGDVVTPESKWQLFPTLLEMKKPRIRMYPREAVIAEKMHTIVTLGIANSRMRDYYDLFTLSQQFEFKGSVLVNACSQTFTQRRTDIPKDTPLGLSKAFAEDGEKQKQWKAFISKNNVHNIPDSLEIVINAINEFLFPVIQAVFASERFRKTWKAGQMWV